MKLKDQQLRNSKLYLILDAQVSGYDQLFEVARKAMRFGVDVMQLRDKQGKACDMLEFAKRILAVTQHKIPFIVNDRVDVALMAGADGVHLGQDDLPIAQARNVLGEDAIIGRSCQTLEHALIAQDEKADYIGFGSVFKTLTKPEREPMDLTLLAKIFQEINIPVFAIGGINANNVAALRSIGADRIAVCRDICQSNNIEQTISTLIS